MANTYAWIISQMNCYPSVDNLNDVIFCIHWRRSATTIVNEKEYYTDIYGAFTCEQPNPQDFTPYNDITYDQVCSWLKRPAANFKPETPKLVRSTAPPYRLLLSPAKPDTVAQLATKGPFS